VAWWLLFACRFSAHSGVRNRGDPDFGMLEFWMLDEIRDVCQAANFQDPLPTFKSLYKIAKEKGKWQQVALPCLIKMCVGARGGGGGGGGFCG
jgi:hypothetical protein